MNTLLECPNCQYQFSKVVYVSRTATCPQCSSTGYMLLAVEPVENYPASWYRHRPKQYDVISDSATGQHIVKEI